MVLVSINLIFGQVSEAAFTFFRLALLVNISFIFTYSTPALDILNAFDKFFFPLNLIKKDLANKASFTVSLTLVFIPLLFNEISKFNEVRKIKQVNLTPALLVPFLIYVIKLATNMADVIESRGLLQEHEI